MGVGVAVFRVRDPIRGTGGAGHGHAHAHGGLRLTPMPPHPDGCALRSRQARPPAGSRFQRIRGRLPRSGRGGGRGLSQAGQYGDQTSGIRPEFRGITDVIGSALGLIGARRSFIPACSGVRPRLRELQS